MISKRSSDGPGFYTRNEGSDELLLHASGRHPNVQDPSVEVLFLRGSTSRTDGLTVVQLHVTSTLRTIWPSLHRTCCWSQSSRKRGPRSRPSLFHVLRANIKPPERVWHNWSESSLRFRRVSSWRSRSVWKKSASVVAKDSAHIAAVFHMLLQRLGFLERALDGFGVFRLGFRSFFAFFCSYSRFASFSSRATDWRLPWPHRRHLFRP